MAGIIGDWIIRPENRYVVEYSYRGGKTQFEILDKKLRSFKSHDLVGRIKNSPLCHMYIAMSYFNYNYALLYHLLVRSVYTDNDDELLIRLGNSTCRFGRTEFALISGLSFRELEPVGQSIEDVPPSSLIARADPETGLVDLSRTPFIGPLKNISIANLEEALVNATDPEIAYKVGLIYFIEAVMYGKQPKKGVSPFVFGFVDDTSRFLSYPWGRYFWDLSMDIWKRKRESMKIPLKAKGRKGNGKEKKKNDIASLMVVLFGWAYETLPESVVSKLAIRDNEVDIPRVLRWRPRNGRVQEKTLNKLLERDALDVKRYLERNDLEFRMLRDNGLTEDDIKSQPPLYPPPVVAALALVGPPPAKNDHVDATTRASASYEAVPSIARDNESDIGDLRNTMNNVTDEMRAKIKIARGDVRRGRQESIELIDDARNEITVSNQSIVRHILSNKAEETEQNRVIWTTIQRILGLLNQQHRVGGVDPIEPSHAVAQSEYPREHAPVYQPGFQAELDAHKVMGEEPHLPEEKMEDTCSLGDDSRGTGSAETMERYESPISRKRRVKFIEKIDDRVVKFMHWYNSAEYEVIVLPTSSEEDDSEVVALRCWFKNLVTDKGHLHELHVKAYVNLLKRRMTAQPYAFKEGSVVLHTEFAYAMEKCCLLHPTLYAHVWKPHTTAYTIWCIESDHFVAVKMSLKDWTMHIYDSLDDNENKDVILKHLDSWARYMRIVLQAAPKVQELPQMLDASEPPFKIDFQTDVKLPHMKGRGDCAVYALKYIEEMVTVGHIRRVSDEVMMRFRSEIAADLYCQYFGD